MDDPATWDTDDSSTCPCPPPAVSVYVLPHGDSRFRRSLTRMLESHMLHDVGFGAGPTAHEFVSDIDGNKRDIQLEHGTGHSIFPSLTLPNTSPPARARVPPARTCRQDMVNMGV